MGPKLVLKMLLISANLSLSKVMAQYYHTSFFVVCKVKGKEWRSSISDKNENALEPTWTHQQVDINYKEATNIMTIELRDKEHPDGKPVCSASQEISLFLEKADATVNVPLKDGDAVVGMIKFETFSAQKEVVLSTDSKYPHVKQGCNVCKDTHKGPSGANY